MASETFWAEYYSHVLAQGFRYCNIVVARGDSSGRPATEKTSVITKLFRSKGRPKKKDKKASGNEGC